MGRWVVIDPERQFASGYVFNGNTAVNGYDEDGRFFLAALFGGLYMGWQYMNNRDAGYSVGESFFRAGFSTAILAASIYTGSSVAALDIAGSSTLSVAGASTVSSAGNYFLSGGKSGFTTSLGFGNINWSIGSFRFADFSGPWYDDINTVLSYATLASDILDVENTDAKQAQKNKLDPKGGKTDAEIKAEMKKVRDGWLEDGSNFFGYRPKNVSPKYIRDNLRYDPMGLDVAGYPHDVGIYDIGGNGAVSTYLNSNAARANFEAILNVAPEIINQKDNIMRLKAFLGLGFFSTSFTTNIYIRYNYLPPIIRKK